ncbi:MAG: DUF1045 domain-containing protein [Paracoccaceae bacterium]
MKFNRYALYYVPPANSDWGAWATAWLGWDAAQGAEVAHPDVPGLPLPISDITQTPRKYGLHATIKPPMRLADGHSAEDLADACATLCAGLNPVRLDGLAVEHLGRFLALRPQGDETALNALAARCVEALDPFRAPPGAAELERRRKSGLNAQQDANLLRWGYPFVMDQFRFHITLSGRLSQNDGITTKAALDQHLSPLLPVPFDLSELALAGEAEDGRFHVIHRYALSG